MPQARRQEERREVDESNYRGQGEGATPRCALNRLWPKPKVTKVTASAICAKRQLAAAVCRDFVSAGCEDNETDSLSCSSGCLSYGMAWLRLPSITLSEWTNKSNNKNGYRLSYFAFSFSLSMICGVLWWHVDCIIRHCTIWYFVRFGIVTKRIIECSYILNLLVW